MRCRELQIDGDTSLLPVGYCRKVGFSLIQQVIMKKNTSMGMSKSWVFYFNGLLLRKIQVIRIIQE